jgi:aspartyl-tRNA(Asn)/glutamyl-tRNA(Gln) amidotransferase subunit A
MSQTLSVVARTEQCLANITQYDPQVNAFITVMEEGALAGAGQADAGVERGDPCGLLHGLPISVKDCIDVAEVRCTNGTRFFEKYVPVEDALVVQRLRRAGAIIVGKTNLHEFAYGSTTQNPHYGPTRNPWDLQRIPSGSSGGAAVSVALEMCAGAVASDTGGSIRTPAAVNGVSGLRPTVGAIPMSGSMTQLCPAIDTVGPIASTVEIIARMFTVMAGYDDRDPTSVAHVWDEFLQRLDDGIEGVRIGLPKNYFFEDLAPGIGEAVRASAEKLAAAGAVLVDLELAGAEVTLKEIMPMVWADCYEFHQERVEQQPEMFGEDVLGRILLGRDVSGRDYAAALRCRERWSRVVQRALREVDVILTPTTPLPAPLIPDSRDMLSTTHQLTRFTYPLSWAGLPGLSVPCGFTADGLPIGMLLNGACWEEGILLRLGSAFQRDTNWHLRRPPMLHG